MNLKLKSNIGVIILIILVGIYIFALGECWNYLLDSHWIALVD
ncbi:TPA: hypothetical protein ACPYU1_001976 [Raoultella planticola]|nr:hypothetical protein [Raoultella sp. BIGb0138]